MKEDVKPRSYRSPLRAEQARETRRRIRDAADALFRERGYAGTSMDDIAEAAGVSRQTVFTAFGSKASLLKEALDVRLAGDDEPLSLPERPEVQRILASTDPHEVIRLQAALHVEIAERLLPLSTALNQGAATDPELAELVRFYERGLLEGPTEIVDVFARLGRLRKGQSRRKLKEAMYLVIQPETLRVAFELGWSRKQVEDWLVTCLEAVLLDPA